MFGDIKEIRNIFLQEDESVTVPSGEIWKVIASISWADTHDFDREAVYLELNSDAVLSIDLPETDSDVQFSASPSTELFAEEGDTLTARNRMDDRDIVIHLSVIALEDDS